MALETKIVQVYPSEYDTLVAKKEWEMFGWALDSVRQHDDYRASGTYVVNQLTFHRETSSSWYDEMIQLESKYKQYKSVKKRYERAQEESKSFCVSPSMFSVLLGFIFYIIPGIILLKKRKKSLERKKALDELVSKHASMQKELIQEMGKIEDRAKFLLKS